MSNFWKRTGALLDSRRLDALFVVAAALFVFFLAIDSAPLAEAMESAAKVIAFVQRVFLNCTEDASRIGLFYPAVGILCLALVVRLVFQTPPNFLRLPVALGFLFLQVAYLAFRAVATLCLDTWGDAIVSVLFLLSEVFIHFRIALGNFSLLRLTDRTAEADESQRVVRSREFTPSVDVFLPTYSEPAEMLRRTIIGCQSIDYPNKAIYLLDDQRRPFMKALAAELGCEYLDRPDNRHAKAGNLNHALSNSKAEFIACFDADFVPCTDFLERTIGFFRDPEVAMVQTPQNFFNEDAITRNLGLEHALEDEQRLFFRTIQPGRDAVNAVVCHGSCFVVRRSALEKIGGIPTETITEDWATSIKLQSAGYKICYLNEPLSAGVSADKSGEFVQQRARWAQGTLQALFASTNPLTIRGLSWKQRVVHLSGIVYYLGSLSSAFNLIAPLLFLFFGTHLLRMTVAEILIYRIPFAAGFYLLYSWLTGGTRSPFWTEFYETFLAPSICLTVLRSLLKPFGAPFRVTNKNIGRGEIAFNRQVAAPFVILMVAHLLGYAFSIGAGRHLEEPEAFGIATYYAVQNIIVLWMCLLVCVDIAQEHSFVRFPRKFPCLLTWDDTGVTGESVSVSEGDLIFTSARQDCALPATVFLHVPALGLQDVAARVQKAGSTITLEFRHLTLPQRRLLISELFCRPKIWERPARSEAKAAWEYLCSGLRMYPLAESP